MRRGIGCNQWSEEKEMYEASVWVERTDVEEVRIEVEGGSELFLTSGQARELVAIIGEALREARR